MTDWRVHRVSGSAEVLHRALPLDERGVWCFSVDRPALVLGSTQRSVLVGDQLATEPAVEVVVRDSGGGAVHLVPGEHVWMDVVIPRDDPLWVDDVSASARWLGEVWVAAMGDVGVLGAAVHDGPMLNREIGRHVCFAGLAAGEVTSDGAKLVGISQRRSRDGARFQCVVLRAWNVEPILSLLGACIDDPMKTAMRAVAVATADASVTAVEDAFLSRLP